ncbi:hypothetical protein PLCT2_00845 [Planctomycetaceae bacterium]|nr:hypothetical protein PLCT2_00845 [Planctomycetaceae bacterium]
MNTYRTKALLAFASVGVSALLFGCVSAREPEARVKTDTSRTDTSKTDTSKSGSSLISHKLPEPKPIAAFMGKGIEYLVKAQHESGGWGGGTHDHQEVRDPHAVKADPASTAFALMALMRAGHRPFEGAQKDVVLRGTKFLIAVVEDASPDGPKITTLENTQPQVKLGPYIDTSMTSQFLSRVLPYLEKDPALKKRAEAALDKCLKKIEKSQKDDGSWNYGGWAPVLQSAMMNQALELGDLAGRIVTKSALEKSREYQRTNVNSATGEVSADAAAGVALYSGGAGQRGAAKDSSEAEQAITLAIEKGKLPKDAKVTEENLKVAGFKQEQAAQKAQAWSQNEVMTRRLDDENYLSGFGNNGGEEFISFMMISESMVITGGKKWEDWTAKLHTMFEKIQNGDGSWNGHHCITSPVVCTAAALLCLTADRDVHVRLDDLAAITADKK